MGFFDKLKGGFAFNKMAKAYKEALDCLCEYNIYNDIRYVYKAAWIFNNCILASIDKWHWNLFAGIMIPDYNQLGRISVQEANLIVMGKIGTISQRLEEEEQSIINRILEGDYIPQVDALISQNIKEKLSP